MLKLFSFFLRRTPPLRFRTAVLLLCACLGSGILTSAHGAERPKIISLAELGQQSTGGRPQTPGNTIATVHFAGEHHLLVTFPIRRLMKRLPDTLPTDDDRTIEAVLVDIPSGKVAARTSWRVHDAGQYLWDLGHGRFLLRVRSHLTTFAPVAHLSAAEPFEEHKFLTFEDRIVGMVVSAESDLLTVETTTRPLPSPTAVAIKTSDADIEINFFRLQHTGEAVTATRAGAVRSTIPLALPLTTDGYLDISAESKIRWLFDYIPHEGKKIELSPYDTSCFPHAVFVSHSEFIAFGCRGSIDKLEIGAFNMRAEEMWQQNFFQSFVFPTFSFAPTSGRFALGRALTSVSPSMLNPDTDPVGDMLTNQDITVFQSTTGKQVFHTVLTPVQRSGQNFALAPDGLSIAVIREGNIELHQLPAPSSHDRQEIKANREFALEHSNAPIRLPTRVHAVTVATSAQPTPTPQPAPPSATRTEVATEAKPPASPKPIENIVNLGDVPSEDGRKPPTLYKPGEPVPK